MQPQTQTKAERWKRFGEALDLYYTDPGNQGTVPSQLYDLVANGVTYRNFGRNVQQYILGGLPESCPEDVRKRMEKYQLLTKETKAMLAARNLRRQPRRPNPHNGTLVQFSHSGDVQTSTFEVPLSAAEIQMLQDLGNAVNASLPQSEVTASHPFNQAASFASMSVDTEPTDTFPNGILPYAGSGSAAPLPYSPAFDFLPDNDTAQTALKADEAFQTPDANSFSQIPYPMDQDQGNRMSSSYLSPYRQLPLPPTNQVAPLVPQPTDTFSYGDLPDDHSYSATEYSPALNFQPPAQAQAYTTGDYPSQSGHTHPRPFSPAHPSPAHHGSTHSGGGRGMRG